MCSPSTPTTPSTPKANAENRKPYDFKLREGVSVRAYPYNPSAATEQRIQGRVLEPQKSWPEKTPNKKNKLDDIIDNNDKELRYVLTKDLEVVFGSNDPQGPYHSNLAGGDHVDVLAAGEIICQKQGNTFTVTLNNKSGHYRPGVECLATMQAYLKAAYPDNSFTFECQQWTEQDGNDAFKAYNPNEEKMRQTEGAFKEELARRKAENSPAAALASPSPVGSPKSYNTPPAAKALFADGTPTHSPFGSPESPFRRKGDTSNHSASSSPAARALDFSF